MFSNQSFVYVFFLFICAFFFGCSSKKSDPASGVSKKSTYLQHSSVRGTAGLPGTAALVATPRDQGDAASAKERIISQIKKSDYAVIYKEASAGFRAVGPEEQFVAQWNKQLLETGPFKGIKETAATVRASDGFIIYLFAVQYEKKNKELRLTFGRSKKDKMELTGINQHEIK